MAIMDALTQHEGMLQVLQATTEIVCFLHEFRICLSKELLVCLQFLRLLSLVRLPLIFLIVRQETAKASVDILRVTHCTIRRLQ